MCGRFVHRHACCKETAIFNSAQNDSCVIHTVYAAISPPLSAIFSRSVLVPLS